MLAMVASLAGLVMPGVAAGQRTGLIQLDRRSGAVELGALKIDERRSRTDQETWSRDELRFIEGLELKLGGSVYHRRLVHWRLGTDLELQEEVVGGQNEVLPGGDVHVALLEKHRFGVTLDASVAENLVDRPFARTYQVMSLFYGATLYGRRIPVPFFVSYGHTKRSGTGSSAEIDETGDEVTAGAQYQVAKRSRGRLEYKWFDQEALDRRTRGQRFVATNSTALSEDERDRLTGNFRAQQQSDVAETRFYGGDILLDWRHSPSLSSRQQVSAQRTEAAQSFINNYEVNATLRHQLYDSLTSSGGVALRAEDAAFGDQRNYIARLNEDYTKRLGGWGRLRVALDGEGEYIEARPQTNIAFVTDESVRLLSDTPVELSRSDIDAATVVVTDADGTVVYGEDQDYALTTRGPIVSIRRLVTGDIPDGGTVLVDYQYRLLGAGDLFGRTLGAYVGVIVREAVTVYGRVSYYDQQRLSGNIDTRDDHRERRLVGLKLAGLFFAATAELESSTSRFSSFWSVAETLTVFLPNVRGWRASVGGGHRLARYRDPEEQVNRYTANATLGARLTKRLRADIGADFQRERWVSEVERDLDDLDAFGGKSTLAWRYRALTADLTGRLSLIDRAGQKERASLIYLRLRRDF